MLFEIFYISSFEMHIYNYLNDCSVCTDCRNSECDGKYTNWVDEAPRSDNELCVYITWSGRWDVSYCNESRPFVCQFSKNNNISFATTVFSLNRD